MMPMRLRVYNSQRKAWRQGSVSAITVALLAFFLVVGGPSPSYGEERHLAGYGEKISIHNNGSARVETTVMLAGVTDKTLLLPLNYLWVEQIQARIKETGEIIPAAIATVDGIDCLRVELSEAASRQGGVLLISFRDPAYLLWKNAGPRDHGLYRWKSEFRNTSPFTIDAYEMEVVLPAGFAVFQIQKSAPAMRKNVPEPPYNFYRDQDGDHIRIRTRGITLGKECFVEYTFAENKRSYGLLIGGLAAILALLYFFRDTFKETGNGS